jgi:hypothetical protein
MSDSTTPVLDLTLMDVGGDDNVWGQKNNGNYSALDSWAGSVNAQIASLEAQIQSLQSQIANSGEVIGSVKWWPGPNGIPNGWVACNGELISVAQYPTAAYVLGAYWGGDGVNTVGVPDMRGCVPVGFDAGTGRLQGQYGPDRWGGIGGAAATVLTVAQMPAHTHVGWTDVQGYHAHNVGNVLGFEGGAWVQGASGTQVNAQTVQTDFQDAHSHNVFTEPAGSGAAFTLCQVGCLGQWIIRIA